MGLALPKPFRNKEILLRALEGQSPELIAAVFDLEVSTVQSILKSPLVQQEMARLGGELHRKTMDKIIERSNEALEVVTDIMRGELGSELRLKAAKDILDRNLELKPKDSAIKDFGEGLGESIIRALARKQSEENDRTGSREPCANPPESLEPGETARDDTGSQPELPLFDKVR